MESGDTVETKYYALLRGLQKQHKELWDLTTAPAPFRSNELFNGMLCNKKNVSTIGCLNQFGEMCRFTYA